MTSEKIQWDITLQLLSPLQIGAGTLGMVERTELFIPGRVIWGALTATLVQRALINPSYDDYLRVGKQISPHETHFGTFFPSVDKGVTCWLPIYQQGQRVWRPRADPACNETLTEEEIRNRLVTGLAGNATEPDRMATDDGSLHETDMIAPVIRSGNMFFPVCFRGVVSLPASITINNHVQEVNEETLAAVLNQCRLGGGRKRGWGSVKVHSISRRESAARSLTYQNYGLDYVLLTAPVHPVKAEHIGSTGRTFLAVYREHSGSKGSGRDFSASTLCWETGTLIPKENFHHIL